MTLPASGTITFGQVNTELSLSATAAISLNDAAVRGLFGVASGAISMSNGWGKSAVIQGALWAWGKNSNGMLGVGNTVNRSSPVQAGSLTSWVQASSGTNFAAGITANGTLWTWGTNSLGQLGLGDTTNRSTPVQVGTLTTWKSVACSGQLALAAVKTDGTLWTCGYNGQGTLGNNTTVSQSSLIQVGTLTNWKNIACGASHILATKTDGTLWAWGGDGYGQLGLNDTVPRSSPVQVGSLTTWSQVACGAQWALALKTDGTIWAWGFSLNGQLGTTGGYISSPVQVGSMTDWKTIAAGYNTGLGIKTNGTLWAWGSNSNGQLGIGSASVAKFSSPTQVGSMTNWSYVGGSEQLTIAIKTDGTLWTWGGDAYGQLGLNDTVPRSSPVQVGSLTTWKFLATGATSTAAYAIK